MPLTGREQPASSPGLSPATLRGAVIALGASSVITQLTLMRELWAAFQGNELALGVVLGNWFLLTGLGAALGRHSEHARDPDGRLLAGQMFIAIVPLAQICLVRATRDLLFLRGADVGLLETTLGSFVGLLPYGLASGYLLTLAVALASRREGPAGLGTVYGADSLGSAAGGLVFTYALVRWFDHFNLLWCAAWLNLVFAGTAAGMLRRRAIVSVAGALGRLIDRRLVPLQPEPFHGIENGALRLGRRSFAVGVLDAEQELAAVMPGEQPVENGRPNVPDVNMACRTRRKSHAYAHGWKLSITAGGTVSERTMGRNAAHPRDLRRAIMSLPFREHGPFGPSASSRRFSPGNNVAPLRGASLRSTGGRFSRHANGVLHRNRVSFPSSTPKASLTAVAFRSFTGRRRHPS